MSGPEYEQTDIIPALRPEPGNTAVDTFGPVTGARHRRPARSWFLPAAGVAAILAASIAAMYATYTLGGHTPTGPTPVPSVVSEAPVAVEPAPSVWSPSTRPSRTRADRRRSRTPSPSPTSATPSPRETPTPAASSRPPMSPTPTRMVSPSEEPSESPSTSGTPTTSPSTSPKVSPS